MQLSIVVPCYNEEKNIPLILERFKKAEEQFCKMQNIDPEKAPNHIELILVNNGSSDNSAEVMKKELEKEEHAFARSVLVKVNKGYGHGILSGLKAAKGHVLAWTHADMQTDPCDVIKAYKKLKSSSKPANTVVKGRRIKRGLGDTLFTFGMSVIASVVLGKKLFDINAQPKVFPRKFYNAMKRPPQDFSLDLFWFYLAKKKGYEIKTIDVLFTERIHGESKWAFSFKSKFKTIMRTIKYIFGLRKMLKKK